MSDIVRGKILSYLSIKVTRSVASNDRFTQDKYEKHTQSFKYWFSCMHLNSCLL